MLLYKNLIFQGVKGKVQLRALFDTQATHSCIHTDEAIRLGIIELNNTLQAEGSDGRDFLPIQAWSPLFFYIESYRLSDVFLVANQLSEEVIIGSLTLQKWGIELDFARDIVLVNQVRKKVRI